jgi:hypothetical protein
MNPLHVLIGPLHLSSRDSDSGYTPTNQLHRRDPSDPHRPRLIAGLGFQEPRLRRA